MIGPVQQSGVNVYDVRTKCEEGNPLCYGIINDIETYLNKPKVQKLIGADIEFKGCNMDVNKKFLMNGDWMKPFQTGLPALLDAGVNILIYAGDADFICNWMGNKVCPCIFNLF
jgi:cathepsin A (carboxypeptidase C)